MDIWDFLARNTTSSKLQFKKWLDITSGHFSFKDSTHSEISQVKRIVRSAQEVYSESGRILILLSSHQYFSNELDQYIPLFLSPVHLEWRKKEQELHWEQIGTYFINPSLYSGYIELTIHEIDSWINSQTYVDPSKIISGVSALYFDLNHKAYLQKDLELVQSNRLTSGALQDLFNDEIYKFYSAPSPDFLSIIHGLPIDYSQAKAITLAHNNSCHISGPPGTGKSQTILNLAIQEMLAGKRVAILSQKKAALDVLLQRFDRLDLNSLVLNLLDDTNIHSFYRSIETRLEKLLTKGDYSSNENFNYTYFKHCVRIIEDYFTAVQQLRKKENKKINDYELENDIHTYALLNVFFPRQDFIQISPKDIIQKVIQTQELLKGLNLLLDHTLGLLATLEQPLNIVTQFNFDILRKLVKHKKLPKKVAQMELKIKRHLASKPRENFLVKIQKDKLSYYLEHLKEDRFWKNWFKPKAKEIEGEILKINKDWHALKIWNKIEYVTSALEYIAWEEEYQRLNLEDRNQRQETLAGSESENLKYVFNKLNANLPSWSFVSANWLSKNDFQEKKWRELIQNVKWILQKNPNLTSWSVQQFLELDWSSERPMENYLWEKLCSLDFKNLREWEQFRYNTKESPQQYPVLKNYNVRELVRMRNFVRSNYTNFMNYQLVSTLEGYQRENEEYLHSVLNTRRKETKIKRDTWKKSIQFIQKKWSSKRMKPTLFQAISKLDIDFLLWLKPITISSLDKMYKFFPLRPELFDVVIMDEASQIELLDSIPALIRAQKVIVVGDGQQLTPTRFFKYHNYSLESPHESLLELAEEKLPSIQLNYQYRAKYRELIYFSNYHFYSNLLNTTNSSSNQAVQRIYLSDGIYQNRKNDQEAEKIVESIMEQMISFGNSKSIGVITFSIQQKEAILSKIEEKIVSSPQFNKLILDLDRTLEPFFVKSIEQVQGDERDIIFISSGYGKNEKGKIYHFFGPILMHKGENRLNVLMSRAREKIVFVTSLMSSDITLSNSSNHGLRLFRELLTYIENPIVSYTPRMKNDKNYWEYLINPFRK